MTDKPVEVIEEAPVSTQVAKPNYVEDVKAYIRRQGMWTQNSLYEFLGGAVWVFRLLGIPDGLTTEDKKEIIVWAITTHVAVR